MFTIDEYLAGIRFVESGSIDGNYEAVNSRSGAYGAYQITLKYMDYIVTRAGYNVLTISDPATQDGVARFWAEYYFAEFGNWDLVAVSWHAGATNARLAQGDTFGPDVTIEQIEAAIPGESRYITKVHDGVLAWRDRNSTLTISLIEGSTELYNPSVAEEPLPPEPEPEPSGCLMFWRN